jgi:ATP phosphoribosyltransferase
MSDTLTIALSKGRIFEQAMPLLAAGGIRATEDPERSRKLILDTNDPQVKLVIIRASDVPTYVEYGAADLGIAGKDVLLEHGGDGLYEPLDLGIARCRMMVAGKPDARLDGRTDRHRQRIATKYVHCAERHFAAKGQQVEIIKLYGSMELAPLVGLADLIVDLVESGNTLKANGLVPLEHICDISSRLVVNKASWKMKHARVTALLEALRGAVAEKQVD